jgi:pyruvate formate lyase activating enzyme
VWLEIVVLLIPTLNDKMDEIKRMAAWIARELGPDVPLFFTRFRPAYKIRQLPPTPASTIRRAGVTARAEGLHFVYAGNMPGVRGENTYCPGCGKAVVERYGHVIRAKRLKESACEACGRAIPGVW